MVKEYNELFSPPEMQNPFDAIKEVDAEVREWWNSRHLARLNRNNSGGYKTIRSDFDKLIEGIE